MFTQFLATLFVALFVGSPVLIGLIIMDNGYSYKLRATPEEKIWHKKQMRIDSIKLYFLVCSFLSALSLMY